MGSAEETITAPSVESILDQSLDGLIVTDNRGRVVYTNPAAQQLFDRSPEGFIGVEFGFPVVPGESAEITIYRRQLGHRVVELRARQIAWQGRKGLLVSLRDITERKQMEEEIQAREQEKTYLMENIADAVITIDENNTITSANKAAAAIFGYPRSDLIGLNAGNLLSQTTESGWEDWLAHAHGPAEQAFGDGELVDMQFTGKRADGTEIALEINASWIDINNKKGYILAARDITSRLEAEHKLHIVSTAIDQSLSAQLIIHRNGLIAYVNRKFCALSGITREEVLDARAASIFNRLGDENTIEEKFALAVKEGGHYETRSYQAGNGEGFWVEQYIAPIHTQGNGITHFLVSLEDVTQKIQLAHQLEHQSTHDSLTGLDNRYGLERKLDNLTRNHEDELDSYYLYYVDIDQFDVINDTCGREAGDRLLKYIADELGRTFSDAELIARLEADDFAVIFRTSSPAAARTRANMILHAIREMRLIAREKHFNPTATVAYACFNQWRSHRSTSIFLQLCEIGANIAKDRGGDQVYNIEEGDENLVRHRHDTQGASLIHRALEQGLFCLYYQPIRKIHGDSKRLSYELLIRLKDGDQILSPARFLPAAEKYKLGNRIDQWVINHAFAWLADNPAHVANLEHCGINISAESLANSSLIDYIMEKLRAYRIPPEKICLEVTETAAVKNLELANGHLGELKNLGCRIALDDFGTGMSSFNYLKQLDVDYLKIDGAFIRNIQNDPIDFAMVNAIKDVGKAMGIQTIAEFVENDDILGILKLIGIDYAQGYGIGKPSFFA